MNTNQTITADDYARAVALAPATPRDRDRDRAARAVAISVTNETHCPRCARAYGVGNPAQFCHYAPSDARISSSGTWFGSIACHRCNMVDRAFMARIGKDENEPLPYAYVARYFVIPIVMNSKTARRDIIAMERNIADNVIVHTDADIVNDADDIARSLGY